MTNTNRNLQQWGITLLRVVIGAIFVAHGAQKLFTMTPAGVTGFMASLGIPAPTLAAYVLITVELLGGLFLILGLLTRLTAAALAVDMIVAILTVHLPAGFFLPNGYEFVLSLLAAAAALTLLGPGAAALDSLVFKSRAASEGTRRSLSRQEA